MGLRVAFITRSCDAHLSHRSFLWRTSFYLNFPTTTQVHHYGKFIWNEAVLCFAHRLNENVFPPCAVTVLREYFVSLICHSKLINRQQLHLRREWNSPSKQAARSGVECVFVLWFTFAPYWMSNLMTLRCPDPAAHHRAVAPCTMWPSNLTTHSCSMFGLKLFKIVLTTLYRPLRAAITSGVNDWSSSSTI